VRALDLTVEYLTLGAVSLAVLVYLLYALVRPEKF
jgi:K+-transporting ATPase KdpF subunit